MAANPSAQVGLGDDASIIGSCPKSPSVMGEALAPALLERQELPAQPEFQTH